MEHEKLIESTRQWVKSFVVELNLCPFAKRELVNNRVRFAVSDASTEEQLLLDLQSELEQLTEDSLIETTLIIHTKVLLDFDDFNQFLNIANSLLLEMQLEGIYQIASFHPNYQFEGTDPADVENYTNRSPYPMLHLIREDSLERAISQYPDVDQIPLRNIALMNSMGHDKLKLLLHDCLKHN